MLIFIERKVAHKWLKVAHKSLAAHNMPEAAHNPWKPAQKRPEPSHKLRKPAHTSTQTLTSITYPQNKKVPNQGTFKSQERSAISLVFYSFVHIQSWKLLF